jgi:chloramphenicol-sensitive protein RarD
MGGASFTRVAGEGFEPTKAMPSDLQSDPFGRSGNLPCSVVHSRSERVKAAQRRSRGTLPNCGSVATVQPIGPRGKIEAAPRDRARLQWTVSQAPQHPVSTPSAQPDAASATAPAATAPPASIDRTGALLGVTAYVLWGAMPLFFPLLQPAGPIEIIAHRVVWSLLFCLLLLVVMRKLPAYRAAFRSRRTVGLLAIAAVLVATNWTVYVYGVLSGHVLDAALGYFINPLVTVLLAVVVLKERLRPAQWVALGIGTAAVIVLTIGVGRLPWIALTLAMSFGLYGLIKNRVGRDVEALPGLAVETTLLFPVSLGYLVFLGATGAGTFATEGAGHALLLASSGVVTALPLLLFSAAARRLPLSLVGMLQYLAPVLQFLVGLLVFNEDMPPARWAGFSLVWLALIILSVDGLRAMRGTRLTVPR